MPKKVKRPWWKRSNKGEDKTRAKPSREEAKREKASRKIKDKISRTGNKNPGD